LNQCQEEMGKKVGDPPLFRPVRQSGSGRNNTLNISFLSSRGLHSPNSPGNLKVGPGHTILLNGPIQARLSGGRAECFGALVRSNSWITVEELRQEPLLVQDECSIEIKPGRGGSWKIVDESSIPSRWTEAAQIVGQQRGTVVIVGDVDSGKSSLSTFIANKCVQNGLRVGVVDADVGQADIGPPTSISSARMSHPVSSLQELKQESAFFLGDTSPSSVPEKLIQFLVKLKQDLSEICDLVLVNTDGWIGDSAALRFKEELVHETRPDLVLGLTRAEEIDPLLNILSTASLRLSSSMYARIRSREERKHAREIGYRRFLDGSRIMRIDQEETRLRLFDRPYQSILRWDRRFKGFLAGLLDGSERLLGIGRIREMSEGFALVETRTGDQPSFLEIGNIALSSSYEETGYGILH
jgi:polynucleotide 5'-kinase involved in rRNA processing